jgi:hypothetical protein
VKCKAPLLQIRHFCIGKAFASGGKTQHKCFTQPASPKHKVWWTCVQPWRWCSMSLFGSGHLDRVLQMQQHNAWVNRLCVRTCYVCTVIHKVLSILERATSWCKFIFVFAAIHTVALQEITAEQHML